MSAVVHHAQKGASVDLSGDCGVWCAINGPRVVGSLAGGTGEPGNLCQKVEICYDKCDVCLPDRFARDQGMCHGSQQ